MDGYGRENTRHNVAHCTGDKQKQRPGNVFHSRRCLDLWGMKRQKTLERWEMPARQGMRHINRQISRWKKAVQPLPFNPPLDDRMNTAKTHIK